MTSQDVIPSSEMQIDPLRIDIDLARSTSHGSRIFFWSVENFWPVEKLFCRSRIFFGGREFFYRSRIFFGDREFFTGRTVFARSRVFQLSRVFVGNGRFRAITSRGINNMASSDGISAGNMLRQILGRIGDLSAAIDQQGSSFSRGTAPQTTTSVDSEVRNVFAAGHQALSSTASASSPAVSASQNGPLYTMRRNFTNFRTANYRSSRGGKRKGATSSGSFSRDVILLSGPDDEDVPRQGNRVFLQESGHVIMAFPFEKEWSDLEVELKIREAFQDIIPRLVDFEILQSVHTKLLRPTLAQGQYLTGAMIHRIFRDKPIYVRPTQQILKSPKQRKTRDDLDDQVDNEFEVTNGNLELLSSIRAIQRSTFSFVKPVHVSFSGEEAVDAGGPRREYFRLLMSSLKNLGIFQGSWFSHDLHLLRCKKYELGGKLVSWSVLQGGSGPKCLSREGFSVMSNLQANCEGAIAAVKDEELKTVLTDLQSCSSSAEFTALVEKKADVIAGCGYSQIYTSDISSKDEIIHCLLKQAFVFSVHAEIEQFWDGLNSIGKFGEVVRESPELFAAVLGDGQVKLNSIAFKKLYNIDFSDDGSNQRDKEEKTIYCFELFLQDLEEDLIPDLSLEDLLIFITGADAIPPLGFDDPIVISFYDMEGNVKRLPWSSTCALTLNLPRGMNDPQEFNALISNALQNCYGFGKC